MKIYERLKNNFINEEYLILFCKDTIYVMNYKDVKTFNENKVEIYFKSRTLILNGNNFYIKRKNEIELEINGSLTKMEFKYE